MRELCRAEFTVTGDHADARMRMGFYDSNLGVGDRLTLLDDELLENLNEVQFRNGVAAWKSLVSGDFTIETETGGGKTCVYLRTLIEMNRRIRSCVMRGLRGRSGS